MPIWKSYRLNEDNYMRLWNRKNTGNHRKISGGQRFKGKGEEILRLISGDFLDSITILYDSIMVDIWNYLPKLRECRAQRVNSNVY